MAHMIVAASEEGMQKLVEVIVQSVAFEAADSTDFGAFTAGYDIQAHLEGGRVELRNDGTISIKELDIRWDRLIFSLEFDIPEICVGGGCINLGIFGNLCLPQICAFSADPDIRIAPNLAAFVAQEVSVTGSMVARYYDHTASAPRFDPCGELRELLDKLDILQDFPDDRNQWHIHIDPGTVDAIDIDLIDFADIVGDIIEDAIDDAIVDLIPSGWLGDIVVDILAGIDDVVRAILDVGDDFKEWVGDLFNVTWDRSHFIAALLLDFLGHCVPILRFDDPIEMLPEEEDAPAVNIPIRNLTIEVNTDELVVQANIGAVS